MLIIKIYTKLASNNMQWHFEETDFVKLMFFLYINDNGCIIEEGLKDLQNKPIFLILICR